MIFKDKKNNRIKIAARALRTMRQFRQLRPEHTEAGGVLLGRLIDGSENLVIDEATIPDSSDRRSRFNFFRSKNRTQQRINQAWQETNQTRNYLGEWHTHPEDYPTPSGHDIENWKRIVSVSRFEQKALVFLIVGRRAVHAWRVQKGERQAVQLQRIMGRKAKSEERNDE